MNRAWLVLQNDSSPNINHAIAMKQPHSWRNLLQKIPHSSPTVSQIRKSRPGWSTKSKRKKGQTASQELGLRLVTHGLASLTAHGHGNVCLKNHHVSSTIGNMANHQPPLTTTNHHKNHRFIRHGDQPWLSRWCRCTQGAPGLGSQGWARMESTKCPEHPPTGAWPDRRWTTGGCDSTAGCFSSHRGYNH